MNLNTLEQQLIIDEGKRLSTYRDVKGILSVGIGHRIIPTDNIPEGSTISQERCDQLFANDVHNAVMGAIKLFPQFYSLPELVQESICNLVFNMGIGTLSGFHKFIAAIDAGDYEEAGNQLQYSDPPNPQLSPWWTEVGNRAQRIVAAIQGCVDADDTANV